MSEADRIFLIRHPAVALPPGLCYGRSDVAPAAPVGELAARLRAQLPPACHVVASPLQRCRRLAAALGLGFECDPRLVEMDFGEWELRAWNAIERNAIDAWAADPLGFRPPGGERVMEMAERAWRALDDALASSPGPLAIVAHGGPLRAIVGRLAGIPPEAWCQRAIATGELQVFSRPR